MEMLTCIFLEFFNECYIWWQKWAHSHIMAHDMTLLLLLRERETEIMQSLRVIKKSNLVGYSVRFH